jgi:hypothetical protein
MPITIQPFEYARSGVPSTRVILDPHFEVAAQAVQTGYDDLLTALRNGARPLGQRWVAIANQFVPRKTGAYAQSIFYRTYIREDTVEIRAYSEQPKGAWIILGTQPHYIEAVNARALRFYWERGPRGPGIYYFAHVNHPGAKPNDWVAKAINVIEPEVETFFNSVLDAWSRGFSGATS